MPHTPESRERARRAAQEDAEEVVAALDLGRVVHPAQGVPLVVLRVDEARQLLVRIASLEDRLTRADRVARGLPEVPYEGPGSQARKRDRPRRMAEAVAARVVTPR